LEGNVYESVQVVDNQYCTELLLCQPGCTDLSAAPMRCSEIATEPTTAPAGPGDVPGMVAGPLTVVEDFEDEEPAVLSFAGNPGSRREGTGPGTVSSSAELLDEKPFIQVIDPLSGAFVNSDGKAGFGKGPKNKNNYNTANQPTYGSSSNNGNKKPASYNKPSSNNSNNSGNNYNGNNNNSSNNSYNKNKNKSTNKNKATKNKNKGASKFKDQGAHGQIDEMADFLQKQKEKEAKKAARLQAQAEKKAKKEAAKAVKAAKRELQKAQKQQKKARILEMEESKEAEKQGRLFTEPSKLNAEKKETAKANKQEAKAAGVFNEDVGYPHRSRSNFLSTAIDVSNARSDGKCGKSAHWAPCALVPTRGRAEATPCCNFATNHCLPVSQCDCPHCVDYARINKATKEIKEAMAINDYEDNIKGELVRNRDLFHIWAVQNIFQPRLLEEVLVRLTEQTENVIVILDNAQKSKCLNSDLSLTTSMDKSVENVLIKMNFKFLQSNNQFHEVLKETLKEFIATNTEERCVRKLDIFNHKVDKTIGAIRKAVMKMRNTLSLSDEDKHIKTPEDISSHFEPDQSRKQKKKELILTRLQQAANDESARLLALEE